MTARRRDPATDDLDDGLSAAERVPREDHRWLRDAETELAGRRPEHEEPTTKVGRAKLAKVRMVPGARRRR